MSISGTTTRARAAGLAAAAAVLAAGAGAYVAEGQESAPQATRAALAQVVNPAGARGRTLGLSRVTIPPHVSLALHRHAGNQIAYIEKGTLTYTVRTGSVPVYRGAADEDPRLVRRIGEGSTGRVRAGEWVVERPHVIHFGANTDDRPVRILLATLFRNGSPPSIVVPD